MVFKEVGTSISKDFVSRPMVVNDVGDDDDFNHVDSPATATMRIWLERIKSFQIPSQWHQWTLTHQIVRRNPNPNLSQP
jgi:hypothetical protein